MDEPDEAAPSGPAETSASTTSQAAEIAITPLAGSRSSTSRFLCHLLEFDDAKILLDCGIVDRREEYLTGDELANVDFDRREYLRHLKELAPKLTLVLLSAPTIEALGLLPYLVCKLRLACPIYATFPCRTLGQLTLSEWVAARSADESQSESDAKSSDAADDTSGDKETPDTANNDKLLRADEVAWRVSLEQIQLAFSRIVPVVYSQVIRLTGRSSSPFSLLAHPAGTTLGSALWSFRSATTDSLLYAPAFNHATERTMDLAAFLVKGKDGRTDLNEAMRRIGILVIGAERCNITATKTKDRDRKLLDIITYHLHEQTTIIMPTDSIGRFMELIVLLEQHWSFSSLAPQFQLCLLASNSEEILSTFRSFGEQMGGHLGTNEAERARVLRLANLRILNSVEQLHTRYPPEQPKLVVCAPASLSHGMARQLIVSSAISSTKALVLLTSPGPPGSLANNLFQRWNDRQPATSRYGSGRVGEVIDFSAPSPNAAITSSTHIRIQNRRKVVLQGEELMQYLEDRRISQEQSRKARAMADRNRRMMEADDASASTDSDDSDDESEGERDRDDITRAIVNDEVGQGAGVGAASYAEPGSAPVLRTHRQGVTRQGFDDGGAPPSGPWDEFLDDYKGGAVGGFDIYVRQTYNPAYRGGITGALSGSTHQSRLRMFPFFERRRKMDTYGEFIDLEGWRARGKGPEETETQLSIADTLLGKRKREDAKTAQVEAPHKYVVEDVNVELRCKIIAIDMEGKADGRALRSIVPLMQPKKLVLINADDHATDTLAEALQSASLTSRDILSPHIGQRIKVAEVTKSFSVRLDDSLMAALALRKIDEYEVVPVKGVIGQTDESTVPLLVPTNSFEASVAKSGSQEQDATMRDTDALPELLAPHFIGDIKLAMLKASLAAKSIPVMFQRGALVCGPVRPATSAAKPKEPKIGRLAQLSGAASRPSPTPEINEEVVDTSGGKVLVRKDGPQLVLDGSPGDTFYAVRTAIYDMHAVGS